jgi:hypothetical protein
MADRLYLSLWFPNFRLESLPAALVSVLTQFEVAGGASNIRAATAYPISWNEAPAYQRIYLTDEVEASKPQPAVADATELLHDDFAYEFETGWELWTPETKAGLDSIWREEFHTARIIGFGPHFEEGIYEQSGHVQVDLGMDTPFLEDEIELGDAGKMRIQQNLQKLIHFTHAVETHSAISARLLWSESGESLAEKLLARLQRVN